jgi:H/ACA ribonucleoprotein complex subunit 4
VSKERLPADKERQLVTRAEDTTNPAYGRAPKDRTIQDLLVNGIINLDSP